MAADAKPSPPTANVSSLGLALRLILGLQFLVVALGVGFMAYNMWPGPVPCLHAGHQAALAELAANGISVPDYPGLASLRADEAAQLCSAGGIWLDWAEFMFPPLDYDLDLEDRASLQEIDAKHMNLSRLGRELESRCPGSLLALQYRQPGLPDFSWLLRECDEPSARELKGAWHHACFPRRTDEVILGFEAAGEQRVLPIITPVREEIGAVMERLVDWLDEQAPLVLTFVDQLEAGDEATALSYRHHPLMFAALAHWHVLLIQPLVVEKDHANWRLAIDLSSRIMQHYGYSTVLAPARLEHFFLDVLRRFTATEVAKAKTTDVELAEVALRTQAAQRQAAFRAEIAALCRQQNSNQLYDHLLRRTEVVDAELVKCAARERKEAAAAQQ